MATFSQAIAFVLANEGGYQNDPNDAGNYDDAGNLLGTNYGITPKVARAYGYAGPMEALPLETATAIYAQEYWSPYLDQVESDAIAAKILDYRVNFGNGGGTLVAQRAANQFEGISIAEDGGLGPETVAAINSIDRAAYMQALVEAGEARYRGIAASNPQEAGFLPGWLERVVRIPAEYPGTSVGVLLLLIVGGVLLFARKQGDATAAGMLLLLICAGLLAMGRKSWS